MKKIKWIEQLLCMQYLHFDKNLLEYNMEKEALEEAMAGDDLINN